MMSGIRKLVYGNRATHRFKDEKGNPIALSRLCRNGPKAFLSCLLRKLFCIRPPVPWISYDARRVIERILPQNADILEFGSGNSTLWYAKRAKSVYSIEDDRAWFAIVQGMLTRSRLGNVHYFLRDPPAYAQFEESAG